MNDNLALRPGAGPRTEQDRARALMLVSADAGGQLRRDVAAGLAPCPEYLRLEQLYGVQLLDWSSLGSSRGRRCGVQSLQHVAAALRRLRRVEAILSDGEHLGIPLAMALRALPRGTRRHVVIGHHLMSGAKRPMFRWLRAQRGMDRIIVHSPNQVEPVTRELRLPPGLVTVVPYGVDTAFWSPWTAEAEEDDLVFSAGREHRDFRCLAEACDGLGRVFLTDDSAHSPNAHRTQPAVWPANVTRRSLDPIAIRRMYARAGVVVVPLLPSGFPFGITAVLEAMSMGKAVVVSATEGLRGVVDDGRTGLVVGAGDVAALRDALGHLMADPGERRRLGENARRAAERRYGLDAYVARLAQHLGLV